MRSQGDGPRVGSQEGPWEGGAKGGDLGASGEGQGWGRGEDLVASGKGPTREGGDLGASGKDPRGGGGERSWEPVRSRKRPSLPISL